MQPIKKAYKKDFPEKSHYSDKFIYKLHNRSQYSRSPDGTYNPNEYDHDGNYRGSDILDETYFPFQRKPSGFWYAKKDSWFNRISFEPGDYYPHTGYIYEVKINKTVKINDMINSEAVLMLENLPEMKNFYSKYRMRYSDLHEPYNNDVLIKPEKYAFLSRGSINWIKVAKDYGGIEILGARFQNREDPNKNINYFDQDNWFHNWDVHSGCVWNIKCIDIRLIN